LFIPGERYPQGEEKQASPIRATLPDKDFYQAGLNVG
jgi:hypothetical protein